MDKRQKYYRYIVNALDKDTLFDFEKDMVKIPWYNQYGPLRFYKNAGEHDSNYKHISGFQDYMVNKYGVQEDELQFLWDAYLNKFVERMEQR
jgi:hypothetical protein